MRLMVRRRRQSSLARTTCSTSRIRSSLKPHPPGKKHQALSIRHQPMPKAQCPIRPLGGLLDPSEAEAGRADLEAHGLAVDDRADLLQVGLEAPLRASGDLASHAALGLRQAAPGDLLAAKRALVAERAAPSFGQWLNHGR